MSDELIELRAKVLHYEHVLQHVADPHQVPGAVPAQTACSECQRMAASALAGEYREDFREMAEDEYDPSENYTGPDPTVKCAYQPCPNHLRRSWTYPEPQWCSKRHREMTL